MAGNKVARYGPTPLTTVMTTNLLNPPAATGGVGMPLSAQYVILRHMRVVNKTSSAATVSLWIGATNGNAAGTEFAWQATQVGANSFLDWFGAARLDAIDFLVGGAGTGSALTLEAEMEVGVSG